MNSLKQEEMNAVNRENMYVQDDVRSTFCRWWDLLRRTAIIEVRSGKVP